MRTDFGPTTSPTATGIRKPTPEYNNQLQSVEGYVNAYTYNAIGQTISVDKTADGEDQYIDYDVTGKVRFVYSDEAKQNKKVEYLYDDRGFRLAKIAYSGNEVRTTWYLRDASGSIMSIYEQAGLPGSATGLTQTEVPIYGAGKLGTYYPAQDASVDYELTDHLGNVRALLREGTMVMTATMEDSNQEDYSNPRVQEMAYFQNLFETEVNDPNMNHTSGTATTVQNPSRSAYLFWQDGVAGIEASDKAIGPAMARSVTAGDVITAEVYARYENKAGYTNEGMTLNMLSSLMANTFVSVAGFEGMSLPQTVQSFSNALGAGAFLDDTDDEVPYAYLNYIIFDEQMGHVASDRKRVTEDGGFDPGEESLPNMHEHVHFASDIVIPAEGKYIYVWVSNESENTKVWFDDLRISHASTFVAQATDYGVWGDVIREEKSDVLTRYRYAYQGQYAEKDEETGWNHFELREYDPVVGRWTRTDPYGQFWSPYLAMQNDPANAVDVDGGYSWLGAFWRSGFGLNGRMYQSGEDFGKTVWGFERDGEHYFGDDARTYLTALGFGSGNDILERAWSEANSPYDVFLNGDAIEPSYPEQYLMPGPKGLKFFTGSTAVTKSLAVTALKRILPSWRKITVDMTHVISNHTKNGMGAKQSGKKDLFPEGLTSTQIEAIVRNAFRNVHTKISTQGDRILVRGESDGMTIEMWINKHTKTIETAYPISY